MDRSELLLAGIKANRHLDVKWILSIYTLGDYPLSDEMLDFKPFDIAINRDNGLRVYFDPIEQNFKPVMGIKPLEPIIEYKGIYHLKAGDVANLKQDIKTTGGNILANLICLVAPFGDKIPYMNKKISASEINSKVEELISTDVISANEYYHFCECVNMLNSLWAVSTPTGSAKSMTVDPKILVERDELLKKHQAELDNPVVLAEIEKQLVQMDKDSFKGTISEDFFISDKSFSTSRKKAHIMYGMDDGMGGGKPAFIKTPLSEGMSVEYLPAQADMTRAASYSRGFLTAQGGELVNYLYRIFMNAKISMDDCGTKLGYKKKLTSDNMKRYFGRFAFDPNSGKTFMVDETNTKQWVGKHLVIRSPGRCKAEAPNYCGHCTDKFFFNSRESVHIETSLPGSIIMNDRMKAMHGRTFKIAWFVPHIHLT